MDGLAADGGFSGSDWFTGFLLQGQVDQELAVSEIDVEWFEKIHLAGEEWEKQRDFDLYRVGADGFHQPIFMAVADPVGGAVYLVFFTGKENYRDE